MTCAELATLKDCSLRFVENGAGEEVERGVDVDGRAKVVTVVVVVVGEESVGVAVGKIFEEGSLRQRLP